MLLTNLTLALGLITTSIVGTTVTVQPHQNTVHRITPANIPLPPDELKKKNF